MGAAFGGFPPPKLFAREELPEEVIENVIDESEVEAQAEETAWGRRYTVDTTVGKPPPPPNRLE